jgi:hypothetical protein
LPPSAHFSEETSMHDAAASGAASPATTDAGEPPGRRPDRIGRARPGSTRLAAPGHARGADDPRPPPQTATGHDGTGYTVAGDGPEAGEVASAGACPQPSAPPAIESR